MGGSSKFRLSDYANVSSDSDSESSDTDAPDDEPVFLTQRSVQTGPSRNSSQPNRHDTIDLTALGDRPSLSPPPVDMNPSNPTQKQFPGKTKLVTQETCLQMILEVLPDIAVEHVLNLIKEKTTDLDRTTSKCEYLITQLLDSGDYPKERDQVNKNKRKRSDEDAWSEYEDADQYIGGLDQTEIAYRQDALELLKDEFLSIPVRHIGHIISEHRTVFKAYCVLDQQLTKYHLATRRPFTKIVKARTCRDAERKLVERGSQLPKELFAAKHKMEIEAAKRLKIEEDERAEHLNLAQARLNNEMSECQCCFDDFPINRMVCCNGDKIHFFCYECAKRYVEGEMGQSRCRPVCFADSSCGGTFTRRQFKLFLGEKSFERLEHMQQLEDIAAAGLDFLSECPFCDFKMECHPVEVDKEFRCNKCGKTSCRLCQKETHIPFTCEEAKKDNQLTMRHVVEEAMSAALIRNCNKCKHPFVKEYGCNKMTCSHCRNVQCYVCSKDVTDYKHFSNQNCPLHDNVETRHEEEVKKAANEAMEKVRAENPGITDADLMIKVSDKVLNAENARRGRAQVDAERFPYRMINGQLRPVPAQPAPFQVQAPPALPPALQAQQYVAAPFAVHNPLAPHAVIPNPFAPQPQVQVVNPQLQPGNYMVGVVPVFAPQPQLAVPHFQPGMQPLVQHQQAEYQQQRLHIQQQMQQQRQHQIQLQQEQIRLHRELQQLRRHGQPQEPDFDFLDQIYLPRG